MTVPQRLKLASHISLTPDKLSLSCSQPDPTSPEWAIWSAAETSLQILGQKHMDVKMWSRKAPSRDGRYLDARKQLPQSWVGNLPSESLQVTKVGTGNWEGAPRPWGAGTVLRARERAPQSRLQSDVHRLQEVNRALREQMEVLSSQLLTGRTQSQSDLPDITAENLRKELGP